VFVGDNGDGTMAFRTVGPGLLGRLEYDDDVIVTVFICSVGGVDNLVPLSLSVERFVCFDGTIVASVVRVVR